MPDIDRKMSPNEIIIAKSREFALTSPKPTSEEIRKSLFRAIFSPVQADTPDIELVKGFFKKHAEWIGKDHDRMGRLQARAISHSFKDIFPKNDPDAEDAIKHFFEVLYLSWDYVGQCVEIGMSVLLKEIKKDFSFSDDEESVFKKTFYRQPHLGDMPLLLLLGLIHKSTQGVIMARKRGGACPPVMRLILDSIGDYTTKPVDERIVISVCAMYSCLNDLEREMDQRRTSYKKEREYVDANHPVAIMNKGDSSIDITVGKHPKIMNNVSPGFASYDRIPDGDISGPINEKSLQTEDETTIL